MNQPNDHPGKLLVVDDDARVAHLLVRFFSQEGYEVQAASTTKQMDRILLRDHIDLLILDLMMPGEDGLAACRRLRAANSRVAVIMLSAKSQDVDRIVGLEVGADDYVTKPFNPQELLARVRAILRRKPPGEAPGAPSTVQETIGFGEFSLDLATRTLRKSGEGVSLTSGEFAMLKALARHPRQVLSRDRLARLARGRVYEAYERALDVQIYRLRKLIEHDAAAPRHIRTIWGVGYMFEPDPT